MPHADASNFAAGVTKTDAYERVIEQTKALVEGQRNWCIELDISVLLRESKRLMNDSNLANTSSLLWYAYKSLPSPSNAVNWAGEDNHPPLLTIEAGYIDPSYNNTGFYVRDPLTRSTLILGPFHGKVACQTISFGQGVCGAAAAQKSTIVVDDVEQWPGHIACDGDSRSEIVTPIVKDGRVVAIIDVDCAEGGGFDAEDKQWLEELAGILAESCDW